MSKPKSNLIEASLISIGIFVGGLGLQGNAKAAVHHAHDNVKYSNQDSYTVKSSAAYLNNNNQNNQSGAASNGNVLKKKKASKVKKATSNQSVAQTQTSTSNNYNASSASSSVYNYNEQKHVKKSKVTTTIKTKLKHKRHKKSAKYASHIVHNASSVASNVSQTSSAASVGTSQNQSSASTPLSNKFSVDELIKEGKKYLGASYEYGGNGSDGNFDCSGFTQYLYQHFNISLPRTAQQQYDAYEHVDASQAKKGDLVFFGADPTDITHVGIYMGKGQMLDAQDQGVITESINVPWWNVVGYARII